MSQTTKIIVSVGAVIVGLSVLWWYLLSGNQAPFQFASLIDNIMQKHTVSAVSAQASSNTSVSNTLSIKGDMGSLDDINAYLTQINTQVHLGASQLSQSENVSSLQNIKQAANTLQSVISLIIQARPLFEPAITNSKITTLVSVLHSVDIDTSNASSQVSVAESALSTTTQMTTADKKQAIMELQNALTHIESAQHNMIVIYSALKSVLKN